MALIKLACVGVLYEQKSLKELLQKGLLKAAIVRNSCSVT